MKSVIDKLIAIALLEVGTRESGGNNCGKDIVEYQEATWLKPAPWPWCAAFICWIVREWLKDQEVCFALGIEPDKQEEWRCKDASAFGWEKWAKTRGLTVLTENDKAKVGDIVIFDFSHIGIVIKDQVGNYIETVEGNTNGAGDRDSTTGDGVWIKKRNKTLTKCYIRFFV